ncbi:hypothetical protein RYX36_037096, partial [Vicia faba]
GIQYRLQNTTFSPFFLKDYLNSPVSPITNVLPLSLVLLVSLIKEAFEDWKRFQNDMSINNNVIDVLQDHKWVPMPWKKLQVGDIIKVSLQCSICFCARFNFVLYMLLTRTYNLKRRALVEDFGFRN